MKIAFFELEGWEEEIVKKELAPSTGSTSSLQAGSGQAGHEFQFVLGKAHEWGAAARDTEAMSIFVDSRVDGAVLDQFPQLKFIATRSTGFDHIDLAACKKRGITVSYVPGYGDNTVAEFAFGLILSLTRKIYRAIDQIKEAEDFSLRGLRGVDIKGKTIGVVGTGRIGREMITIAKGFGMNVLAYDPKQDDELAQSLGFTYVPLHDLLQQSDIVSLHVPYNEATHHLINLDNIRVMKRGSYLINTARGGVLETGALLFALREEILAGAGLDVLEEEGDIKDELKFLSEGKVEAGKLQTMLQEHALINMPNVLITPHNAFNSQEALMRILKITIENIAAYANGKPQNVVQ
ncbi:MAG: hydroxyacid dehydrogenase [Candidatus Jorgensenbacteria bacterium]|nr:hydroxyacid dehydrogenase [Candidatus Jorgensenbacteria bacterium]